MERSRLYMLLGWLNAVVNERLRYTPLGWTKRYEFSDADTQCAMECIDQWVDKVCPGKSTHINPEDLPWKALCTTLSQALYGGRIANSFDQAALDSFICNIFRVESYGYNATVAFDMTATPEEGEGGGGEESTGAAGVPLVTLPNGNGKEVFEAWITALPDKNSPTWLGLPSTAENQLQSVMGQHVLAGLVVLTGGEVGAGGESALVTAALGSSSSSGGGSKDRVLQSVLQVCSLWLSTLPSSLPAGSTEISSDESPLGRFLAREGERGTDILRLVRDDLERVLAYCTGAAKSTNSIRHLLGCFSKGQLPATWGSCFESPPGVSISAWVSNLADRCASIGCSAQGGGGGGAASYWLGGMFAPEAFVTATRQLSAQANQWSLEDLELHLEIGVAASEGVADTIIRNLVFECAQWTEAEGITLSSSLRSRLPPSRLRWRRRQEAPRAGGAFLALPVYLDETRSSLVVEVLVDIPAHVAPAVWTQRGVALVLQSST